MESQNQTQHYLSITTSNMPAQGTSIVSDAVKGSIITLRKHFNLEYPQIAGLLNLEASTPGKVYRAIESRAPTNSLRDLLAAVPFERHSGRQPKVRDGSTLSARIRHAIILYGSYDIVTAVSDVIGDVGITLSRATITKIAHEHRDAEQTKEIVRGVRTKKPPLNDSARLERVDYSYWLIREFNLHFPKLVFVCYDETSKPIGGITRKQFQWRPKGQSSNIIPVHNATQPAFSLMICAATSSDTNIHVARPCILWAKETDEDREETLRRVTRANRKAREHIEYLAERARLPGTREFEALKELNQNTLNDNKKARAKNRSKGLTGSAINKGTKRLKKPEQLYKAKDFIYKDSKGMSGLWYAEHVLKAAIFPYYKAIRERNQGNHVYLVQDNVHLHKLGLRYCKPEIDADKIQFAPHPPNSPDLHPIERCFGKLGDYLAEYSVQNNSEQARRDAERYVQKVWQEDEQMRQFMADQLHPTKFVALAESCIRADGWNNFTA